MESFCLMLVEAHNSIVNQISKPRDQPMLTGPLGAPGATWARAYSDC